ncbi:K(+) efflux antiporter 3, chloroplastic, partial [Tanacetum coccineum]
MTTKLEQVYHLLYGDGSRAALLESAGISSPKAVMVMYERRQRAVKAVERIRLAFPA